MGRRWRLGVGVGLAVAGLAALVAFTLLNGGTASWLTGTRNPPSSSLSVSAPSQASGEDLYATFCETCHGREGRGDGVAAQLSRVPPADFTRAEFKVRSTASGALPRDQDLHDVIRRGAGGDGAMPSFNMLNPTDVDRLVERIKTFSPRWQQEVPPPALPLPPRRSTDATRGARIYRDWGCAECHGSTGAGDGPRARDLRTSRGHSDQPTDLRRPWTFKAGRDEPDLVRSVLTGFNGTTMPGLQMPVGGEAGVWDVAAYLRSLQQEKPAAEPAGDTATAHGYWKTPVPAQSGDVAAVSCAACHATQFRDWLGARHALAMSPGVWAQMRDQPELSGNCLGCHAPLSEQGRDDFLMSDGVSCSVCHARGGQRFGPPVRAETVSPLVARFLAPHGAVNARPFFESSDFCARCHQFAEGEGAKVNGKFLENTVEEWRTSRAAREGKTCQTCHMPDRRHLFRGIHDPETVRGGVRFEFDARRNGSRVEARMTLTNTETGHAFPTYIVPEVWMRIELVPEAGGAGTLVASKVIGRRAVSESGQWRELSDTRLAQDETATLTYEGVLPRGMGAVAGSIIVRPDAYHLGSLSGHLRTARSEQSRQMYEQALEEMRQSDYVLFHEMWGVPR